MASCQLVLHVKNQAELVNVLVQMTSLRRERREGWYTIPSAVAVLICSSYVASLESRVEKLEKRLAYARSRKASVAMHDGEEPVEAPDRKDSLATIRAAIHGKAARRREAADVNELVSDFGFLLVLSICPFSYRKLTCTARSMPPLVILSPLPLT
jgi:hypothetical protein